MFNRGVLAQTLLGPPWWNNLCAPQTAFIALFGVIHHGVPFSCLAVSQCSDTLQMIHSCYFNMIQQQQVGQLCVQNWQQFRDFLMWQLPLCGTGCTHHIQISIIPQSMVMQISQMLWMSFKTSFQNWLGHLGQLMNRLSFRCVVHNRVMLTNNRCGASATSFAGKIPPIVHVIPKMEWLDF